MIMSGIQHTSPADIAKVHTNTIHSYSHIMYVINVANVSYKNQLYLSLLASDYTLLVKSTVKSNRAQ